MKNYFLKILLTNYKESFNLLASKIQRIKNRIKVLSVKEPKSN